MEENIGSGIKTVGVIAGVIVTLGILVIGGQYMAKVAGWVSADVVDDFSQYVVEDTTVTVEQEEKTRTLLDPLTVIMGALGVLKERERDVLVSRFSLAGGKKTTLEAI